MAKKPKHHLVVSFVYVLALAGGDAHAKEQVSGAEKPRIECLDKICPGDVEPSRNVATQIALKVNGQWYIAPKEYFSTGKNGGGFYWSSRHPMFKGGDYPERDQNFPDKAIEVFLGTPRQVVPSMYQQLQVAKRTTSVLETKVLRPGLERWRTQEKDRLVETWYVATNLKEPNGDPPTIACRGADLKKYRCTTGFMWRPNVGANLRFRATHGPDWPEIYQEANRVINLLRKS